MADKKLSVFVYGTLMKGMGNERVISRFRRKHIPAKISGVDMYSVGGFPALVRGTGSYWGELVVFDESVDPEELYADMDWLEGYRKYSKGTSMYLREPVTVVLKDGSSVDTEFYLWNRDVSHLVKIDPEEFSSYRDFCKRRYSA